MASRPVFIPRLDGDRFVETLFVDFDWFPGLSLKQSQKSISSLHFSAKSVAQVNEILEVSSKSIDPCGEGLSAFNLMIRTVKHGVEYSVECAFQSSKVFEFGGPYRDLLRSTSRDARSDPRLKSSGRLIGFDFYGDKWDLVPETAFYDWLYINALIKNEGLAGYARRFDAFTDIAFNPAKSINCQAYSLALYVSMYKRGIVSDALDKSKFLSSVSGQSLAR